jgi:hypothetical protein
MRARTLLGAIASLSAATRGCAAQAELVARLRGELEDQDELERAHAAELRALRAQLPEIDDPQARCRWSTYKDVPCARVPELRWRSTTSMRSSKCSELGT